MTATTATRIESLAWVREHVSTPGDFAFRGIVPVVTKDGVVDGSKVVEFTDRAQYVAHMADQPMPRGYANGGKGEYRALLKGAQRDLTPRRPVKPRKAKPLAPIGANAPKAPEGDVATWEPKPGAVPGAWVAFDIDGREVLGQVWSESARAGYVWVIPADDSLRARENGGAYEVRVKWTPVVGDARDDVPTLLDVEPEAPADVEQSSDAEILAGIDRAVESGEMIRFTSDLAPATPTAGDVVVTTFTREANLRHVVRSTTSYGGAEFHCGTFTSVEFMAAGDPAVETCAECASKAPAALLPAPRAEDAVPGIPAPSENVGSLTVSEIDGAVKVVTADPVITVSEMLTDNLNPDRVRFEGDIMTVLDERGTALVTYRLDPMTVPAPVGGHTTRRAYRIDAPQVTSAPQDAEPASAGTDARPAAARLVTDIFGRGCIVVRDDVAQVLRDGQAQGWTEFPGCAAGVSRVHPDGSPVADAVRAVLDAIAGYSRTNLPGANPYPYGRDLAELDGWHCPVYPESAWSDRERHVVPGAHDDGFAGIKPVGRCEADQIEGIPAGWEFYG